MFDELRIVLGDYYFVVTVTEISFLVDSSWVDRTNNTYWSSGATWSTDHWETTDGGIIILTPIGSWPTTINATVIKISGTRHFLFGGETTFTLELNSVTALSSAITGKEIGGSGSVTMQADLVLPEAPIAGLWTSYVSTAETSS